MAVPVAVPVAAPVATELRPIPHGYSFTNFPSSAINDEFDAQDLVALFGNEACVDEATSPCVPTAEASAWARMVNQAHFSGHCEGLVVKASQRFVSGSQPLTVELINSGQTTHDIIQSFATQFYSEVQDERNNWATKSLREVVDQLGDAFAKGKTDYVLGLYSPRGGHAVLPYAIEFIDQDNVIVRVYDSNWPGKNRFVKMNLATDEWSFSFSSADPENDAKSWTGKRGDIDLASLSTRRDLTCPFCVSGGKVLNSLVVIRATDDNWSISANGVEYNHQTKQSNEVHIRPILNGAKFSVDDDDFEDRAELRRFLFLGGYDLVEILRILNLQSTTNSAAKVEDVHVVQPSSISQVTSASETGATVEVAKDSIATIGVEATLTVSAANIVVSAIGASSEVKVDEAQLTATVTTASGQSASVVASASIPQVVIQAQQSEVSAPIIITSKSIDEEVQITEISSEGTKTTRQSDEQLDLNKL